MIEGDFGIMIEIPNQKTRLRIQPIAKLMAAPKWQLETTRALKEPLFLWITTGQGRMTVAGSARGFHPHNAIFLPAGTLHSFQNATRVQGSAIYFGQTQQLDLPQTPLHLRLRDVNSQNEVAQLVDAVQRELDSDRPKALQAATYQLGLLSIWLDRHSEGKEDAAQSASSLSANERLTARYSALLEREYGSSLNVTDYAMALGVTPTHLTRACRASCGQTALELMQQRRLFEARRLLADTRIPVQDISRKLGFSTPGYFSRAFSQAVGMAPSTYRKSQGGTSAP